MSIKESERKRPYRSRGPHKEGCLCRICKAVSNKAAVAVAQAPNPFCAIGSLKRGTKFEYGGKKYQMGNKDSDCVVALELVSSKVTTFGLKVIVYPEENK